MFSVIRIKVKWYLFDLYLPCIKGVVIGSVLLFGLCDVMKKEIQLNNSHMGIQTTNIEIWMLNQLSVSEVKFPRTSAPFLALYVIRLCERQFWHFLRRNFQHLSVGCTKIGQFSDTDEKTRFNDTYLHLYKFKCVNCKF